MPATRPRADREPPRDEPDESAESAHALLCRMRDLQVEANRAEMARARAMTVLFQQFSTDFEARRTADPHFTATPLAETVTETQPVTGQTVGRIRSDLEAVLLMDEHLPWLAAYVDAGRLDLHRAKPVTDALKDDLADYPECRARFAALMARWFARAAADAPTLINKTVTQIRNHVHYVVTKVLSSEFDDRFKRRHAQRRVTSAATGDGMAALTIDTDQVSVKLADHHLDLLARDARSGGDPRTLEQLRADLAIDLLTGRLSPPSAPSAPGRWARPVLNITVPIQTVMGLSDEPGRLGPEVIPASLVRHVAADPGSTWYRLLTDPARQSVELSTTSYRPTGPIWREVVATQPTCFAPTCERPASECELDHRLRYPEGQTSTGNLGPACPRHHRSKHAPGASLESGRHGVLRYTTRSGMTHLVSPAEQPVCEDAQAGPLWERLVEIQPNTAELAEAVDGLRHHRRIDTTLEAEANRRRQLTEDYRHSYPEASEEDIDQWVWSFDDEAPPITRRAPRHWDRPPDEAPLSPLVS